MDDINILAKVAYGNGQDPIDWAITLAATQLNARREIEKARATDPAAYPGYRLDLDDWSVARRIVGELLDAGWTPPQLPDAPKEA
jgi:hypothetical protein